MLFCFSQEESAALLSQMFAQQLAGNQEGRAGPKLPSKAIFEASKIPEGQGSEHTGNGHGSRSIPPNPFEGLTSLPFQDTGKRHLAKPVHAMFSVQPIFT